MRPVIFSGLFALLAFSAHAQSPKELFQRGAVKAMEKSSEGMLVEKNRRIIEFSVAQAVLFGLEADLDLEGVDIEIDSTGETLDGKNRSESFSTYFLANWKEDGEDKRGACRLRSHFLVPVNESVTEIYFDKNKKRKLRVMLKSSETQMEFKTPRENPVCYSS